VVIRAVSFCLTIGFGAYGEFIVHWMKFFLLPTMAIETILTIETAINYVINHKLRLHPLLTLYCRILEIIR
jgi:succinate-acetate transporter protein